MLGCAHSLHRVARLPVQTCALRALARDLSNVSPQRLRAAGVSAAQQALTRCWC